MAADRCICVIDHTHLSLFLEAVSCDQILKAELSLSSWNVVASVRECVIGQVCWGWGCGGVGGGGKEGGGRVWWGE